MASIIKADTLQSTTSNVFVLNSAGTEYARFDSSGVFQLANPTTFPAGTAALPSITATGDTNTGLYFPAADTIAFSEGGAEAMRIDSSGNVGIGTVSPGRRLSLKGNDVWHKFEETAGSGRSWLIGTGSGTNFRIYDETAALDRMAVDTSGNLQFNSGYGSVATGYGCRAWVNFNGDGTVAIRASGNVTSITDNGTGDYTANFTTAMPDANYGYALSGSQVGANQSNINPRDGGFATSSFRITTFNMDATPAARDYDLVSITIFR
jgi:hypothetical protein